MRRLIVLAAGLLLAGCVAQPQDPLFGAYKMQVQPNGWELDVSGKMTEGFASAVQSAVQANPKITMIHLTSPGGFTYEGYKLALVIKERHLATYASTTCASACTIAFIAGYPRYLATTARLGFHSISVNGQSSPIGNDHVRLLYQEAGLPAPFIEKALTTPPSSIWVPTATELHEAHVVDAFVDVKVFPPAVITYWANADELDRKLKADTFFNLLSTIDVQSYRQVRQIYLDGASAGLGFGQMKANIQTFVIDTLLPSYVRRAPDDKLLAWKRLQLQSFKAVEDTSPGACIAIVVPKVSIVDSINEHDTTSDLSKAADEAFTDLIKAAVAHPAQGRSDAADQAALKNFNHRTIDSGSTDLTTTLNEIKQHNKDPRLFCKVMDQYFTAVFQQPPATAAAILRGLEKHT